MDKSIKTVLQSVLDNQTQNEITAYLFDGKNVTQLENPVIMRNTILLELYSPNQFLILHAEKEADIEPDEFKSGLERILAVGITHNNQTYRILGASSSLKDGRLWLSTEDVRNDIQSRFSSSNEALTYLGIFSTNCTYGIFDLEEEIQVVDDGHTVSESDVITGDGMGFISTDLLKRMRLPIRQIQVRLVGEFLAKGTLHPYEGNIPVVITRSMIKGKVVPESGRHKFKFGIRAIARELKFKSNWTLLQFLSKVTIESTIPALEIELADLQHVLEDRNSALQFLGTIEDEERTKLERFLTAGLPPTHPYLNNKLRKHLRKRYKDLALGSAIALKGFMAASAQLPQNVVCIPDLPAGEIVITRYPIRDYASFKSVTNNPASVKDAKPGSIYLNPDLCSMIDGDYDGDLIAVLTDSIIYNEVSSEKFGNGYRRLPEPQKTRRNDSLGLLPYVAAESINQNRIGHLTYLINAAILEGKSEVLPLLSQALQASVMSLKWSTTVDWQTIDAVTEELTICETMREAKFNKKAFESFVPTLPAEYQDHPLFIPYRTVERHFNALPNGKDLLEFRYTIPPFEYPIQNKISEAKSVVRLFNGWVSEILQSTEENEDPTELLQTPIEFLSKWGESKQSDREIWAAAIWGCIHERTESRSIGSAAFHAFEVETSNLIRKHAGNKIKPTITPQLTSRMKTLTAVGGAFDCDGDTIYDKRKNFRTKIKSLGRLVTVETQPNEKDSTGLDFYIDGIRIGSLPQDQKGKFDLPIGTIFDAVITLNGKAVYLHTQ